MTTDQARSLLARNEAEINRLHDKIKATFRLKDKSSELYREWQSACAAFHGTYDQLAFPGGYWKSQEDNAKSRILSGDSVTIENALAFLEVRPYFFRSGYMFKELLRALKRTPLTARQSERLQAVIYRGKMLGESVKSATRSRSAAEISAKGRKA